MVRMGRLTTHVLDTASGVPAMGVEIRLFALAKGRVLVASAVTNEDGRSGNPLLSGDQFETGEYELEFDIGAYFRSRGAELDDPAFLDTVIIRFAMHAGEHYHVPLLASPWSYSTYRGS